ncbi:MAG: YicC family protein [Desulfobacteraceae bacterium]|nr:MAG: YicC family protein [Desulfobacteraceae bacterium]
MLKSMTAYASLEKTEQGLTVGIEFRTYNSRFLDIALRLPSGYNGLEERIKSLINAYLVRGRAEVRIWVKDASATAGAFEVDMDKAKAYLAAAHSLSAHLSVPGELTLPLLLAVPGIIQKAENSEAAEHHWPFLEQCLRQAVAIIDQMRRQEGGHIGEDFARRLEWMESQLKQIESAADGMLDHHRDKLMTRIETLVKGALPLDPLRIAQEAAIIADRSDISEEIVRAKSHIAQFRAIMQGEEPAGRKLNFLLQEFNREFNTMGSKVGQAELAHIIVAVKAEIEKLREQVQNLE